MRFVPMLALALLLPLAAQAQSAPPAAAVPPAGPALPGATAESRQEAKALAAVLQLSNRAQLMLAQLRFDAVRATVQASGKTPEESARIVDEVLVPDFKARQGEIEALLIENLAAGFSADDLKQLRLFFLTPLGERWLHTMPLVERDNLVQYQALAQKIFHDAADKHAAELRARGLKF